MVYGGFSSDSGRVDGNLVRVTNGGTVNAAVYGGFSSGTAQVSGNTARVESGGTARSHVFGGDGYQGRVTGNTATVDSGGSVRQNIYGGAGRDLNQVDRNRVTVSGTVGGQAYGGYNVSGGQVNDNAVTVGSGGRVTDSVYGGLGVSNAQVLNNTVTVEGSGQAGGPVSGGVGHDGRVADNKATVEAGGLVENDLYGGLASGDGPVNANTATVNGRVEMSVYGGYGSGDGQVSGNTATVNGRAGGSAYGGYSSGTGLVSGNTVNLPGGEVAGDVFGGYSAQGPATGNTVNFSGGTVRGGLFGGGGLGSGPDRTGGNTLNVRGVGLSAGRVQNFQHYNFDIPDSARSGDTMLSLTGSDPVDLTGASVGVAFLGEGSPLGDRSGDQLTLIDQVEGDFADRNVTLAKGLSLTYDAWLVRQGPALNLLFQPTQNNEQAKALAQSRISGQFMLNQGADLAAGAGLEQALRATRARDGAGPAFFSAVSYVDGEIDTGSHLDSDGWSLLAGLAWKSEADAPDWLAGVFFETGRGNYHAWNSFGASSNVKSSGDTEYYGGGLMARYRHDSGLRLEGSARLGRVETDYQARGYLSPSQPSYDLDNNYYGAHLGLGYDLDLNDRLNLDLSAKYLWTRQADKSVSVEQESIHFPETDSQRLRGGGRLRYAAAPMFETYLGLYAEYEADGEASSRNRTSGVSHKPLKTRGTTGIAELGFSISPTDSRNLSLGFDLQGFTGRREGLGGSLSLTWAF